MIPLLPSDLPAPADKPVLRLKPTGSASIDFQPEVPEPPPPPASSASANPPEKSKKKKKPSLGMAGYVKPLAWLFFFLLAGFMAALRYGGLFSVQPLLTAYGPWAILACHAVVILLAFDEDFFTGVLCILVPGYSLYYLVFRAGRPFFTALVFGLLAGVGEDTYLVVKDLSMNIYETVTDLIAGSRRK